MSDQIPENPKPETPSTDADGFVAEKAKMAWCKCGHNSVQHGIDSPHPCTLGGCECAAYTPEAKKAQGPQRKVDLKQIIKEARKEGNAESHRSWLEERIRKYWQEYNEEEYPLDEISLWIQLIQLNDTSRLAPSFRRVPLRNSDLPELSLKLYKDHSPQ